MKAVVFDFDNTIMEWKPEYIYVLRNILKKYIPKIEDNKVKEINKTFDEYEKNFDMIDYKKFIEFINKMCNVSLPLEFVLELIEGQKECVSEDYSLGEVFEYLSKKYDLYIITNWFTETQVGRLKKLDLYKYFKGVYGGDINYLKPHIKSYDVILNKYLPKDCIVIGDSLKNDVILPLSLGMDAIWLTKKVSKKYKTIIKLDEIKEIL